LDAALGVFADKGYAAARINDIAEAAGLSKGGIYAHFRSKDEIFEALLTKVFEAVDPAVPPLPVDMLVTVDVLVTRIVDPVYATIVRPAALSVIRMLLADGARAPQAVGRWTAMVLDPSHAELEGLVRRGVAQGSLRDGVLTHSPRLMLAPVTQAIFDLLVHGEQAHAQIRQQRDLHVILLREQLEPGR
jgi:AcrR family transcriptional regulator